MKKLHLKIGTSSRNDLVIEGSGIDSHHLELFCDEYKNVFITDLKSINGTFVNNQELNGFKLLKAGDEVRLGKTHIFDWEKLVLNYDFFEKKEEVVYLTKNDEESTLTHSSKEIDFSKINRELFYIYGLIILLIILMFFVL